MKAPNATRNSRLLHADRVRMGAAKETQFQLLFESLGQGALFLDRAGIIQNANPAAEQILGYSRADIVGRNGRDPMFQMRDANGAPFPDGASPRILASADGQARRGVVVSIFNPVLRERRLLNVDYLPLRKKGARNFVQVCSIFTDITEQQRTQSALRKSEQHLAAAQRMAAVGSLYFDFATNTVEWSDQTYTVFGLEKGKFLPSREAVTSLIHPDDREFFLEHLFENSKNAPWGADLGAVEYRIIRSDGHTRTLNRESELVRDEKRAAIGVLSTIRDVTDLREAEQRNADLQLQLYHSQKLESLGTLAGGIAHDLNNTLVPILSLSEAILSKPQGAAPDRALVEIIHQAGQRARDLVAQILAFSRREMPKRRPLELLPFMQKTMTMIRATVPSSIKIRQFFADLPTVFVDPGQLHQVIVNLMTNAVQAIGDAQGTITVKLAFSADPTLDRKSQSRKKSFARISVIDTGCGMDEETRRRIFEPFFTTKPVGEGTGLGLAVVHGIVAAHGGHVAGFSKPGEGARIDVLLPLMMDSHYSGASDKPAAAPALSAAVAQDIPA